MAKIDKNKTELAKKKTEYPRLCYINTLKIKNIEKLIASFHERLEAINDVLIREKTLLEDISEVIVNKKVPDLEKIVYEHKSLLERHTKELENITDDCKKIIENSTNIDAIQKDVECLFEDTRGASSKISRLEYSVEAKPKGSTQEIDAKEIKTLQEKLGEMEKYVSPIQNAWKVLKWTILGVTILKAIEYLHEKGFFDALVHMFKRFFCIS